MLTKWPAFRTVLSLIGLALSSGVSSAQVIDSDSVVIRVSVSGGRALPAALVWIYDRATDSVSERETNLKGEVRIPRDLLSRALIRVTHLGYRTVVLDRPEASALGNIFLAEEPIQLKGLLVTSPPPSSCDSQGDDGRGIWERFAASWSRAPAERLSYVMEYGEVVGGPGETDLDHGLSRREIRDHSHALNSRFTTGPLEVDEKIRSRGYAWPNPTSPERMYLVRLGGIHAPHFTSPEFGRLHQFSVVESHPDGTVLEFCSKERGRSYLQGLIQFNSAGEARWIRWEHYLEGERYSGGHATFPEAPSNDDARQYLLPDWSRSWRNLGREDWQGEPQYRFIEETFLSWSIDGRRVF